jgi:hypothetical protein
VYAATDEAVIEKSNHLFLECAMQIWQDRRFVFASSQFMYTNELWN